ncbi:MAG: galactose oxidase-like domain-containing protein, partial [Nitriliruptor sp.]
MRGRRVLAGAFTLALIGAVPVDADAGAATDGRFLEPFSEPTVGGQSTDATCIENEDGSLECKPAAGSLAVLPTGAEELLYFNALEGTENVRGSIVAEFGTTAINAQARRMDLGGGSPTWQPTLPEDGGGFRNGAPGETLLPNGVGNTSGSSNYNDASLFCADLNLQADGRVLVAGGTTYYQEPGIDGLPIGVAELEGMRNTRIYDPADNTWSELPGMNYGRWYPTMVTLGDGSSFVASGVTKLIKPVYRERPTDSLRNVVQTEINDPETGEWSETGTGGDRSLPLFPRLHLLPNGHVFYNTAGQVFNPFGQAYDEALWSIAASFDPTVNRWKDLGAPGLNELTSLEDPDAASERVQELFPEDPAATFEEFLERGQGVGEALASGLAEMDLGPAVEGMLGMASTQGLEGIGNLLGAGFRGSTFSVMMPLEPNEDGEYERSEFLTAGGIVGPTPGTYIPVPFSRIDTVDTSGDTDLSTRFVGSMDTGRFYSTGVPLPTGEVVAFSGSTADEVVGPGTGFPVTDAELFDPETEEWRTVATQGRERVYHNTATLLPDARVLVGGHDMISTLYSSNITLPGGQTPVGRDPSFEIFEPPYLHYGVEQPNLSDVPDVIETEGQEFTFTVDVPADEIESVSLVRNTTITHIVDGDQRNVRLPVVARDGNQVTVVAPPDGNVAPPGPYLLFANRSSDQGAVPSIGAQLTVPFDGEYAAGVLADEPRPEGDPGLGDDLPSLGEALGTNPVTEEGGDDDTERFDEEEDEDTSEGGTPDLPGAPGVPGLPGGDDGDDGGDGGDGDGGDP